MNTTASPAATAGKQTRPLLSVIVQVYNVEKYLDECISSIRAQTYTELEILLLDDGSTDGSGAICDAHAAADSRVRVIHKANSGVSRTRNLGLDKARGELITFVDSDDYLAPDFFADMAEAMLSSSADLAMAGHTRILPDSSRQACSFSPGIIGRKDFSMLFAEVKIQKTAFTWSRIFPAETIRRHNLRFTEDMKLGEDSVFLLTYLQYCRSVCFVANSGYFYRIMPGSLSNRLHSFDSEHLSYRTFKATIESVIDKLALDSAATDELRRSALIYHERCLRAIFNLPASQQNKALKSLDMDIYRAYKVPRTWKGSLLKAVTQRRMTRLTALMRRFMPY